MSHERSALHFGIAGILVSLTVLLGVLYLMLGFAIPRLPANPSLLALFVMTAVSILYSMAQSIGTIYRGYGVGWALLVGDCFYAVVVTPVIALHVWLAIEIGVGVVGAPASCFRLLASWI